MTQWGLDTLFNPAKRHMDDEKRRLQSTREEAGDSSGGKRIDLASGKVVIRRDTDEANEVDAEAEADNGSGRSDRGNGKSRGGRSTKAEPSAAAVRAAKRRGRTI